MREWWNSGLPSALSLRTFGAGAVIVLVFASILRDAITMSWLTALSFCVGGYLAVVILGLILNGLTQGQAPSARRLIALAWIIVAGPVMLLVAGGIAVLGGATVVLPSPGAIVLPSLVLTLWLVMGARIACALSIDDRNRESLLTELARERALAWESTRLIERDRQRLIDEAREILSRRIVDLSREDVAPDATAESLRQLIDESIRPLSHSLNSSQVREDELVDQIAMIRVPSRRSVWSYIAGINRVSPDDRMLAFGSLVVAVAASVVSIAEGMPWAIAVIPIAYAGFLAILLGLVLARSFATEGALRQALRSADRASSLVRQLAWVTRRRLANTMHGEVQARVLASALRVGSLPIDSVASEVESLGTDLRRILDADEGDGDWRLAWERLIAMWELAIEMDIVWGDELDPLLESDKVAGSALVAVMGEAVTNAVRHGSARSLRIRVDVDREDEIHLEVIDDGRVPEAGAPSMGAATLDAVCSSWILNTLPDGHRFEARIPLRRGVIFPKV